MIKWSKKKIIRQLKKLADKLGRSPTRRDDIRLSSAASRYFGSWNEAKKIAGLEVRRYTKWDEKTIIDRLKELAGELGRRPVTKDDPNLADAARSRFGSWNEALQAAGLEIYEPELIDDEKLLGYVEERGAVTIQEVMDAFAVTHSTAIIHLKRLEDVKKFELSKSSGSKYTLWKMFKPKVIGRSLYYCDPIDLARVLEENFRFELSPELDASLRKGITVMLGSYAPEETFRYLHAKYAK